MKSLVLWNPVLDLGRTFIHPTLPWGQANFGPQAVLDLHTRGYLLLDGSFEIGRVLYQELQIHDPYRHYIESILPSMIIHARDDTHVPYAVSSDASRQRASCELLTIEGSGHLFDAPGAQAHVVNLTITWLQKT